MQAKQPVFLREMWQCLGEPFAELERVPRGGYPALPSVFDTSALVRDSVAAASLSAALLADHVDPRADATARTITLDAARITTQVTSASHFLLNGESPDVWAEFSGFWRTSDGWVRTHANYPHHRARLLEALELDAAADRPSFEQRLADLPAHEIERRAAENGAVAVAVRNLHEWDAHPQAVAANTEPLIRMSSRGAAPRREWRGGRASAPLTGIRVLDLTRVIAGPTATQTLALLGADVLRIDSPRLPEISWQHLDTGAAKRSALLDLAVAADRCTFEDLLAGADVVVSGYRPGALERFGLDCLSGGIAGDGSSCGRVVARLGAWGSTGPWANRRGFDSVVQAASGIGWAQTTDGTRPGVLPAQALDYSAGFLMAAGIISALRQQTEEGGSWLLETSLARIASALMQTSGRERPGRDSGDLQPTTRDYRGPAGVITGARPAVQFQDGPEDWPAPARPWGQDQARWID